MQTLRADAPDHLSIAGSEQHPQWFTDAEWRASPQADPEDLRWFTEARFGMFVHFGVSSLRGVELGWGRATHLPPDGGTGPVPDEEYDRLYTEFRLEEFDAAAWVRTAREAGMGYLVVITKHHDGFRLWPTATSDYSIRATPFGRDYLREVVDACHQAGMPVGLYFSQRDWYHPDYDPDGVLPGRDHRRYVDYLAAAVRELLTDYGRIDVLWFDAAWWSGMFEPEDWDAEGLNRLARSLQPHILINNRASIPGDFDTPEQSVGAASRRRPWESCITLGTAWSWVPDDVIKTPAEVVSLLTRTAGGDGNLLLNVGPQADGAIEPRQVAVLTEVGAWLDAHADLIRGTRGGPWLPGRWGASTCRGTRVHLFLRPASGTDHGAVVELPALPAGITGATAADGAPVDWSSTDDRLLLRPPAPAVADGFPVVITLELDTDAFALEPVVVDALSDGTPMAG